jgi:hypothetical protein
MLIKLKGALSRTEIAISYLKCTKYNDQGECVSFDPTGPFQIPMEAATGSSPKKNQITYVPTLKDLAKMDIGGIFDVQDDDSTSDSFGKEGLANWNYWEKRFSSQLKPDCMDFVVMKSIVPTDANVADSLDTRVPSKSGAIKCTDPTGKFEYDYDKAAFDAAMKDWQSEVKYDPKNGNLLKLTTFGKKGVSPGQWIKQEQKVLRELSKQKKSDPKTTNQVIFEQARGWFVDQVNQKINAPKNENGSKKSAKQVTTSGSKNQDIKPSKKVYDGTEQVIVPDSNTSDHSYGMSSSQIIVKPKKDQKENKLDEVTDEPMSHFSIDFE